MSTVNISTLLIERPASFANTEDGIYRVNKILMPNIATPIAGGAGQAVTVTLDFSENNLPADLNYTFVGTPSQACSVSWDNKDIGTVDMILTPLDSGTTLAVGTVDAEIIWAA